MSLYIEEVILFSIQKDNRTQASATLTYACVHVYDILRYTILDPKKFN